MTTAYFFGRFDPIHNGHTALICSALEQIPNIQKLIVVPAYAPPHKTDIKFDFNTRCELVLTACQALPESFKILVSDIEGQLPPPTYTIQTLQALIPDFDQHQHDIPFLMGQDSFLSLTSWKNYDELIQRLYFWVATRPNTENTLVSQDIEAKAIHYTKLQMPPNTASATAVREALANNDHQKLKEHLSPDVLLKIKRYLQPA